MNLELLILRLNYVKYLLMLGRPFQLVWLNPDDNHELMWDYGMCVDTSRGAAVRDLIAKALKGALAPAQQEVIIVIVNAIMVVLVAVVELLIEVH